MQSLNLSIIKQAKGIKMKSIEDSLREYIGSCQIGEMITCPLCKYESKNNKGSAKVFPDKTFKCFACGEWRRLG